MRHEATITSPVTEIEAFGTMGYPQEVVVIVEPPAVEQTRMRTPAETLSSAAPVARRAIHALGSVKPTDLERCAKMEHGDNGVPQMVENVFVSTVLLLANVWDKVENGQVPNRTWDAIRDQWSGDVREYIAMLQKTKKMIDDREIPKENVEAVRPYLLIENFKPEAIAMDTSAVAADLAKASTFPFAFTFTLTSSID